jgi:hypothetical protein
MKRLFMDPMAASREEWLKSAPTAGATEDRCSLAPELLLRHRIRRRKVMSKHVALVLLIGLLSLSLGAASPKTMASDIFGTMGVAIESPVVGEQGGRSGDQKYAGLWVGTFSSENGPKGDITYDLSKDNKGQWRGTVNFKFRNQPEEHKADLQSLQITGGKMKANILEMPGSKGGAREARVEGQFQGDKLEGSIAISPKGSTDITNTWTWKTTKSSAAKLAR